MQLTDNMQLLSGYTVTSRQSANPIPVRPGSIATIGLMPPGTILLPTDHNLPPGSVLLSEAHASTSWQPSLLQKDGQVPQNDSHLSSANCIVIRPPVSVLAQRTLATAGNSSQQGPASFSAFTDTCRHGSNSAAQSLVHEAAAKPVGFSQEINILRRDSDSARETASLSVSEGPSLQGMCSTAHATWRLLSSQDCRLVCMA